MVYLIEGRSGSGKTAYLYDKLAGLAKGGEEKLLYLIPEQSSFECEKRFLSLLGPILQKNVNVMSFTRLYHMVMNKTGKIPGIPIDDDVRKLIMSYTLEELSDTLDVYSKAAAKPQFTEVALTAVKEFKQCGILPETLREKTALAATDELKKKLTELYLIYKQYNGNVDKSGVDPYDNDIRLEKRIAETNFFDGYTIAVDDFSGFTAQQHKIIDLMMKQAKDFYISLCMDVSGGDDLFFTVNRTRARIVEGAKKEGLRVASPIKLCGSKRTSSAALCRFEENIYRHTPLTGSALTKDETDKGITLVCASDIYDECAYIAGKIKDMALDGECRYRDIAVVARSGDKYDGVLDAAFEKCGVPYFMSKPAPVDSKPVFRLAMTALEYMLSQNDEKKLLAAAKTGLSSVEPYAAAQLENYIFTWGIKGRDLFSELTLNPRGYKEEFTDEDKKLLETLNETRKLIVEPFEAFKKELSGSDGKFTALQISKALFNFMEKNRVPELLEKQAKDKAVYSDEGLRLWIMLCDILDKMSTALGSREITLRRYTELFKLVVQGADISDIPQTIDQVLFGTADSVRLSEPYAVFLIGAVEGEFPRKPVPDGVFSDIERAQLISSGLPLYDSCAELFLQEKYFVYSAVSAPRAHLFVTYPKGQLSGGSVQPSTIVSEVERIFPEIERVNTSELEGIERLSNDKTAFELYARNYGRGDAFTKALGEYLSENDEFSEGTAALGSSIKNIGGVLGDSSVKLALFGSNKRLSASQLEKFYQCRFQYFCNYGVGLEDRRKAQLDSLVYGNLLHFILENIVKEYMKNGFRPFSDSALKTLLDDLLKKYIDDELGGTENKSQRFMHLYARSKARAARVVKHVMEQLSQTDFKPVDTELAIDRSGSGIGEFELNDSSGNAVRINGKIDRVDLLDGGKEGYIRVIDYKSSGKELKLDEVLNGLNMQMLIYLMAVTQNGTPRYKMHLEPGGVLYMQSDSSSVSIKDGVTMSTDKLSESAAKKLSGDMKLSGVSLDEEKVIAGMDTSPKKAFVNAEAVSKEQLSMIFDIVCDKIREMSDTLDKGDIAALPVKNKSARSCVCDWCAFRDICRRENSDAMGIIDCRKNSEVLEELGGEKEGGDNDE